MKKQHDNDSYLNGTERKKSFKENTRQQIKIYLKKTVRYSVVVVVAVAVVSVA